MTRVLALDVGTSSVRAQIHDERALPAGREVQLAYGATDADELVALAREAVEGALAGARVSAVATACYGHSLVALDEAGRPLTPVLRWDDTRAAPYARELAARVPDLHARTGCFPHSSYWPAKLARLRAEFPRLFERAALFVTFGEYLHERLFRERARASLSMAASTGLLDVRTREWERALAEELGVADRLPELSHDPHAESTLFDGFASSVGAGGVGPTRATLAVGTSGALRVLAEPPTPEPLPGLFRYWCDERALEGAALSDGGNLLDWLRRTLAVPGDVSVSERPPAAHGLTLVPFLAGERGPWWRDRHGATISGLTLATTPADLRQAALEAVAYLFAEILDRLPAVEELVATGGALLHDADWMQVLADVLERPVVESGVAEGTARGAAVVALARLGIAAPAAPVGRTFEPRAERAEAHRAGRARLRELQSKLTG